MSASITDLYKLGVPHNKFALTMPDGTYYPDFITTPDKRPVEFLRHFDRVRDKAWDQCSFLDLGCSEGTTTLGLAQMGSTAYGVEGRADGIDRAHVLKEIVGFTNVEYSVDNVVNDSAFREVDGIFNAGILYHLEDPVRMMEQCARNARSFVYVDTGHAPKDDAERRNSKFQPNFRDEFIIDYQGLKLRAVNFAEPEDTRETQGEVRRGPRSGIGNSNSVWLAHESLIELMAKLGFPYHETVKYAPIIPRLRTCFFRDPPRPLDRSFSLLQPLPTAANVDDAIATTVARDLDFLKTSKAELSVIGHEPVVSRVTSLLAGAGITPDHIATVPGNSGDYIPTGALSRGLEGRKGIVVLAVPEPLKAVQALVKFDRFDLVLTSLGIQCAKGF